MTAAAEVMSVGSCLGGKYWRKSRIVTDTDHTSAAIRWDGLKAADELDA